MSEGFRLECLYGAGLVDGEVVVVGHGVCHVLILSFLVFLSVSCVPYVILSLLEIQKVYTSTSLRGDKVKREGVNNIADFLRLQTNFYETGFLFMFGFPSTPRRRGPANSLRTRPLLDPGPERVERSRKVPFPPVGARVSRSPSLSSSLVPFPFRPPCLSSSLRSPLGPSPAPSLLLSPRSSTSRFSASSTTCSPSLSLPSSLDAANDPFSPLAPPEKLEDHFPLPLPPSLARTTASRSVSPREPSPVSIRNRERHAREKRERESPAPKTFLDSKEHSCSKGERESGS